MIKNYDTFFLLKWSLLLICCNAFSQTEIYKSNFVFDDFKQGTQAEHIIMVEENILFRSSNQKVYSIDKKEGEIKAVKSEITPYVCNNTFFMDTLKMKF